MKKKIATVTTTQTTGMTNRFDPRRIRNSTTSPLAADVTASVMNRKASKLLKTGTATKSSKNH